MFKPFRLRLMIAAAIALPALQVYADTLTVQISIIPDSAKDKSSMRNGTFWVETSVKNSGKKETKITVWTQPGWSWVSDNPAVSPNIEALRNVPKIYTLAPGKTYTSGIEMHADPRARKPLTFRLGYVPNADRPMSTLPRGQKPENVIWSNPVTLGQ